MSETNNSNDERDKPINIVQTEEEVLVRSIQKWIRFQKSMWQHVTDRLENPSGRYEAYASAMRVTIILMSATITTISDINDVPRVVVTVIAGSLTALTAIEAFFKFAERRSELQQQQREIQAKRDELRYKWMVEVELQTDMKKRLEAALDLLEKGPQAYNDILNKYAFKSKESGEAPTPS